jgi:hypothetical protein
MCRTFIFRRFQELIALVQPRCLTISGDGAVATLVSVALFCFGGIATAQAESVERTFKGRTGQDLRIGVFATLRPDCKSGPLPTIRLKVPPTHGTVTVKQGKVRTTNLKQCLAVEVPAFVVIYKSKPEFSGSDALILEIVNANGRTDVQNITVTVNPISSGEKI